MSKLIAFKLKCKKPFKTFYYIYLLVVFCYANFMFLLSHKLIEMCFKFKGFSILL